MDPDNLIERYQALLSDLLLRRAIEGPLPEPEEARLAQQRADLWDELPEDRQDELESWIDAQVSRSDSMSAVVAEYVATTRRLLLAGASSSSVDTGPDETRLTELLEQMTEAEAAIVRVWREREQSIDPIDVGGSELPFQESPDIRRRPRQDAA